MTELGQDLRCAKCDRLMREGDRYLQQSMDGGMPVLVVCVVCALGGGRMPDETLVGLPVREEPALPVGVFQLRDGFGGVLHEVDTRPELPVSEIAHLILSGGFFRDVDVRRLAAAFLQLTEKKP